MRKLILFGYLFMLTACGSESKPSQSDIPSQVERLYLSISDANQFVKLPLECIDTEFPNKLNQVLSGKEDLKSPEELHPAFYGCYDWHSAVHGHWSLVRMLKAFPEMDESKKIINGLFQHLSKENIEREMEYFENGMNKGFERMYGWAWVLKLTNEINTWDDPAAKPLEENLRPLAELIAKKVKDFLPILHYPIRVGTHTNTAFAMTMIYDYSVAAGDNELKEIVEQRAKNFYSNDSDCPLTWEPSGFDFLSPCIEEADIMRRVLTKEEFRKWLKAFLPELIEEKFELKPGIVSDRTDGHLVHLDGLNYSRAWCLYGIAETLPEYQHLIKIANDHINHSLPSMLDGNYEGGHWLVSFALLALTQDKEL